ncbi:MAG: SPO1 DNA polymerase [Alphaproteobacteria bacterium CG_4_10_14_0_2_um_filter_63_37]|nr:MAG: SPO1 DNA polymerase [Alphaproteobacteria bacterium CG_4_10_14_0_2_um_filter_63_37]
MSTGFSPDCTLCPRLADYRADLKLKYPDYLCQAVDSFGPPGGLLIVGLAPGAHGANATGRPFTGDHAGILLYRALFERGLANQPISHKGDGLALQGARITNAVRCVPPANKPTPDEVRTCRPFLVDELTEARSFFTLGQIGHVALLDALGLPRKSLPFGHGTVGILPDGRRVVSSYHPSRYNTQTGRLTHEMFVSALDLALKGVN